MAHQPCPSVVTTALHFTHVLGNLLCPFLRYPLNFQECERMWLDSTALSPRLLHTSTGLSSGPTTFILFILFMATLAFSLTDPLHFLIHQFASIHPPLSTTAIYPSTFLFLIPYQNHLITTVSFTDMYTDIAFPAARYALYHFIWLIPEFLSLLCHLTIILSDTLLSSTNYNHPSRFLFLQPAIAH